MWRNFFSSGIMYMTIKLTPVELNELCHHLCEIQQFFQLHMYSNSNFTEISLVVLFVNETTL